MMRCISMKIILIPMLHMMITKMDKLYLKFQRKFQTMWQKKFVKQVDWKSTVTVL